MTDPRDAGLMFYATIATAAGEELHRETPDRLALLEWVAAHAAAPGARVVRVEMAATSAPAVRNMLVAIAFGARAG